MKLDHNKIRQKKIQKQAGFNPKGNELHTCMGLNSCKGNGYTGENACAGQGQCATVSHPCHTLNECKGQGGCGLFGTTAEFCYPGENDCRFQGSCGSPILNSRFVMQGPNKGNSVWQLARLRFEQRLKKEKKSFGDSPLPFGPTDDSVSALYNEHPARDQSSCGQSGTRACSYARDKTTREQQAAAHVAAMEKNSQTKYQDGSTLSHCPPKPPC